MSICGIQIFIRSVLKKPFLQGFYLHLLNFSPPGPQQDSSSQMFLFLRMECSPPRQRTICLWSQRLSGPPATGKGLRSRVIIMLLFTLKISPGLGNKLYVHPRRGSVKEIYSFLLSILCKIKMELLILQLNTVLLNTVLR